ncbi:MAG: S1 family peptidase, partial [Pseudonocardia sp.]
MRAADGSHLGNGVLVDPRGILLTTGLAAKNAASGTAVIAELADGRTFTTHPVELPSTEVLKHRLEEAGYPNYGLGDAQEINRITKILREDLNYTGDDPVGQWISRSLDLGALALERGGDTTPLPSVSTTGAVRPGEPIAAVGHPGYDGMQASGLPLTITGGRVVDMSPARVEHEGAPKILFLPFQASPVHGQYGSGLVNSRGELVGVLSRGSNGGMRSGINGPVVTQILVHGLRAAPFGATAPSAVPPLPEPNPLVEWQETARRLSVRLHWITKVLEQMHAGWIKPSPYFSEYVPHYYPGMTAADREPRIAEFAAEMEKAGEQLQEIRRLLADYTARHGDPGIESFVKHAEDQLAEARAQLAEVAAQPTRPDRFYPDVARWAAFTGMIIAVAGQLFLGGARWVWRGSASAVARLRAAADPLGQAGLVGAVALTVAVADGLAKTWGAQYTPLVGLTELPTAIAVAMAVAGVGFATWFAALGRKAPGQRRHLMLGLAGVTLGGFGLSWVPRLFIEGLPSQFTPIAGIGITDLHLMLGVTAAAAAYAALTSAPVRELIEAEKQSSRDQLAREARARAEDRLRAAMSARDEGWA